MTATPPPAALSRWIVLVMAFGCGAAVASNYYGQPLLDVIAETFGVAPSTAGFIVTASQLGYAAGLVFLVPLGDLLERRTLILRLLLATAVALAVTAAAPSVAVLAGALAIVGVTSVVAQILIPLSAALAPEHERGKVVGIVMSGLLIGILVARTVSGLIAQLGGWRLVYALASVVILVLAVTLWRVLPESFPARSDLTYRSLLRSVTALVRTSPLLRRRMIYGATGMGGFSLVWTSITFLLSDAPYEFNEATIGLVGLFGIAGALSAQAAGRLGDRGWTHPATGAFLFVTLAGWGLMAFATDSLVALLAGLVLFDLGIQGQHILNQNRLFTAYPDARSRVVTAYMTGNFVAGALGSATAALAYAAGGWAAITGVGVVIAVIGLAAWVQEQLARGAPAVAASDSPH
ncbi:MAG: MFS transporter [Solirubrobacteraceae bacterium]|nr:MFS transporter [Solirubrobacteraceae bacterium]